MFPSELAGPGIEIAVAPSTVRPQAVLEQAENCLRRNSYVALKNISCDYEEGVLTLRGCLPSYYLKQVAQTTVARLAGVERIVNQIEVIAPNPRAPFLIY
jgi:osmotically-inducible protein OsmY